MTGKIVGFNVKIYNGEPGDDVLIEKFISFDNFDVTEDEFKALPLERQNELIAFFTVDSLGFYIEDIFESGPCQQESQSVTTK